MALWSTHSTGSSLYDTVAASFVAAVPAARAAVALGKPSVPRSGRTKKAINVSGSVTSANPVSTALPVKLKFYRLQREGPQVGLGAAEDDSRVTTGCELPRRRAQAPAYRDVECDCRDPG